MLAMPIVITEEAKKPTGPAIITFFGPDSKSTVKAVNASGIQVASFTVSGHRSDFTITSTICSSHTSSLSGTKHTTIHNFSATLVNSYRFEMVTPKGTIKWKAISELDGTKTWRDENKNVLAKGTEGEDKLEVFVQADEVMLDALLATWMPSCLDMGPGEKGLIMGIKIAAHLIGGGLPMPSGN